MVKERSSYRHPKHDDMVALINQGLKDYAVAQQLGVTRRSVSRVRDILGVKARTNSTTRQDKVARFSTVPDAGGHVHWTGRRSKSNRPVIRQLGVEEPATHVPFEAKYGRPPVGIVKAECGVTDCLTPEHLGDELTRRRNRMMERLLSGMAPVPWDVCPAGVHGWDEHGRFEPNLSPYCKGCNTERVNKSRRDRKVEPGT